MLSLLSFLSSPGAEIRFGLLSFRWYGILISLSVLIGLIISSRLASYREIEPETITNLMPILVLSSLIGARIYYILFRWGNYSGENLWSGINLFGLYFPVPKFLEIWNGGIAIHGALIFGTVAVMIFCRLKKESVWDLLDILMPSVALGQAIGRWGNFFNNEAFGLPTNYPWKLFIPYTSRPEFFINENFFHPTFLYESIWNIFVFILLIALFRYNISGSIRLPSGALSCIYLLSYSIGRLWIEGLRIDPLCLGSTATLCEGGIKIAQLTSFILISLSISGLFWIYQMKRKMPTLGFKENRKS